MALIMVPKIVFIRKHAHDPREKEDDERDTAEQELKYREILRENESLQKKISDVSWLFSIRRNKKMSREVHFFVKRIFMGLFTRVQVQNQGRGPEKQHTISRSL